LIAAGFVAERWLPVLTCPPSNVAAVAPPAGIEIRLAVTDTELWQVADSQNEAYDAGPATAHDVARLRGTRDRGGLVALAIRRPAGADVADGVGGGLVAPPTRGVAELAAVGVRVAYRRRGIARALTALLTRACLQVGIETPFLTPAGAAEERIYRSVGYQSAARMLHISRPG
jgi:GNAT superfamily N-acetyltransferase